MCLLRVPAHRRLIALQHRRSYPHGNAPTAMHTPSIAVGKAALYATSNEGFGAAHNSCETFVDKAAFAWTFATGT